MIGVRDYLEGLGHKVGYDRETGDVLVDNEKGKMKSIGSAGFTLKDDGKYYAENEEDILSALKKSGVSYKNGFLPLRNSLPKGNTVGYNDKTGQVYINGRDYNVDGNSLIKIGSEVFGSRDFINSVGEKEYENDFKAMEESIMRKLANEEYTGYNPARDKEYRAAHDAFMQSAKEDMGKRGLTSDSLIAHYAAQGAEKLLPIYAERDYEKFKDKKQNLKDSLSLLSELDKNAQSAFKANKSANYESASLLADRERDIAERIESDKAFKEKEKEREHEKETAKLKAENDREMLEREYALRLEEAEAKNEMEKEILRLQNDLDISKAQATAYYKALYK